MNNIASKTYDCRMKGQYVKLQQYNSKAQSLNLCEIEIMGYFVNEG